MQYLLLIVLPIAVGVGCLLVRVQRRLVAAVAGIAALVELVLLNRSSVGGTVQFLGVTLRLGSFEHLLLSSLVGLVAVHALVLLACPGGVMAPATALLMLGCVVASTLLQSPIAAVLSLWLGGLIAIFGLVDVRGEPNERNGAQRSLPALVLLWSVGGALLVAGLTLAEGSATVAPVTSGLMLAGLACWLGLVPFNAVVRAPESTALLVALTLLQLGAVGLAPDLQVAGQHALDIPGSRQIMTAIAAVTAVIAPLVSRRGAADISVNLACGNIGLLLFGLLSGVEGAQGAMVGVPAHALAIALLTAMPLLQLRSRERLGGASLFRRAPLPASAFLAGLLLLASLPPLAAWPSRALIWSAAGVRGTWWLVVVVAASATLAVGVIRLGSAVLLDTADAPRITREPSGVPRGARWPCYGALLVLLALAVVGGVYPGALVQRAASAVSEINLGDAMSRSR